MAFAQPKTSVEIPLKDSTENDMQRYVRDFCVEIWNMTQRWEELNGSTYNLLEKIVNNRLFLIYAQPVDVAEEKSVEREEPESDLSALLLGQKDWNGSITNVELQRNRLEQSGTNRTVEEIVRDVEKLVTLVNEQMSWVVDELQNMRERLAGLKKLENIQGDRRNLSGLQNPKLKELSEILPLIVKMYQEELKAKRAALNDLANFNSRDIFLVITASWSHQAFIDRSTLSRLYSLEIIELDFDNLPDDGEEVLAILRGEHATLNFWVDLALAYYRRGNEADFVRILEMSGSEASLEYPEYHQDQMRALDTLAAYYVIQSHKERNKDKKKEWQTKATLLYTTADKIIMYDTYHLLGRAYFCLLEGKIDQAEQQFNFVLNQVGENIPATLGKACIFFQRKEYRKALNCYKSVLRKMPDCPADVRLGIGYCLAKLGRLDKARLAFKRVLDLDKENVSALVALAILDMNTLEQEAIRRGVESFGRAYQIEQENPVVLNHLANHFFYKKELDRVEHLAWHAFQITDNEAMRAESCYQLARSFHQRGNFEKAFQHYYQSTQFATANFVLPYFGLGQMYICREDYDNAIQCFEKVLKACPTNYDTLKILGSLYAHSEPANQKERSERRKKAREIFKKVVEMCPDDVEALIDLAQLTENCDPQGSLDAYTKASTFLSQMIEVDIPPEITNNVGSLYFTVGQYEKAREYFEEALKELGEVVSTGQTDLAALQTTVTYNLARSLEMLCMFDEAERLYKGILQEKPNYIDCYMRLGCLARDKGQIYESSVWFKEGMSVNQSHADAWSLIGNLHMSKFEWAPAQKKFEYILKLPEYHDDPYSFVALGNIWLETLSSIHRKKEKDKDYRERALMMYSKALKVHPKNIWAANGIGCILAQKGAIQEARDIFAQVREATADFSDVWINIAHVYMEQKQYVAAIQMYDNCIKKFNRHNDVSLLLYLARAHYKAGKFSECRHILEKAICEAPDNMMLKFNHAFVLQKLATQMLRDDKSSLEMVTGAVDDLRTAATIFEYISRNKDDTMSQARIVSRTASASEARACYDLLTQAQTYLQRAKAQDEEEQRQRQRQEEERQALKRQQEQEAKEREEKARRELEVLKQMRQEYVEKTKEILRLPTIVEEKRVRGSGRRRKDREGDEFVNDDSDLGDWNAGEGGELRKKKERRGRKKRERREVSSGGSGGEIDEIESRNRREGRKSKKMRFDRNDFELSAKQKTKVKSREFVQSDESSSDEDANKPSKSRLSDDSDDAAGSPEPVKTAESDSSAAEDAIRRTDSDDDSDNEQPKSKHRITNNSDQSSAESSTEDRARSPSDSDDDGVEKTPMKATKRKKIVSSDEDSSENNGIAESNAVVGDSGVDEDAGFAIADDD
ncbi:TPR Domain containing protein [Brugia malayi]|nr:TPR Domain containing protein [Brugia malayi]VIO92177.1 TPR Domain containing protein [Brugia malayi]